MFQHVPGRVRFEDLCAHVARGESVLDALPSEVSAGLRDAPKPIVLVDFAVRDSVAAAMVWIHAIDAKATSAHAIRVHENEHSTCPQASRCKRIATHDGR